MLLNALKHLAGIDSEVKLLNEATIASIQTLKPPIWVAATRALHTDEVLIALSVSAQMNPTAQLALEQLEKLRGCEVHTSVILGSVDEGIFRSLGVRVTN